MLWGDLVLIATGIASIYDYKKRIRKRIDDIIKTEKYCNNIIQVIEKIIDKTEGFHMKTLKFQRY